MKKGPLCRPRTQAGSPPMRSLRELCEELGVSLTRMAGLLRQSATAPKPTLVHEKSSGSWYEPRAFRKWYASATASDSDPQK